MPVRRIIFEELEVELEVPVEVAIFVAVDGQRGVQEVLSDSTCSRLGFHVCYLL